MNAPIRYLLAAAAAADLEPLARRLAQRGELLAFAESGGDAVALSEAGHPDVVLVDLALPGMTGLEACREIHELLPRVSVVLMARGPYLDALRDAMGAGAEGFLVHPVSLQDLDAELDRVEARRSRRPETPPRRAPAQGIWSFLSAKSGEGRTTTLLALAEQLLQMGRQVVVVDFDIQFGDVGFLLGLEEGQPDVYDAIPSPGKVLEGSDLRGRVRLHEVGLPILTAPSLPRNLREPAAPEDLGKLVENLAALYEYVLVDFPVGLPSHLIPVLDRSRLVFVSTRNLPSVIEANLVLKEILRDLGYGPTKLRVLVLGDEEGGDGHDLDRSLDRFAGVLSVPHVGQEVEAAMRVGTPLFHGAPGAPGAMAFRRLTLRLIGPGSVVTPPRPRPAQPLVPDEPG